MLDDVFEVPVAVGVAGGDAEAVVDLAWIVAGDDAVGAVESVAEDPDVAAIF